MVKKYAFFLLLLLFAFTVINAQEESGFYEETEYPYYFDYSEPEDDYTYNYYDDYYYPYFYDYAETDYTETEYASSNDEADYSDIPDEPEEKVSFWKKIDLAYRGSLLIFASGNAVQGADPAPILPSFGVSAIYNRSDRLKFELTEDLYFTNYEYLRYNENQWMPFPCNQENRAAFVLGFLTGIQVSYTFPIGKTGINIRAFAGPVIDIRLVFTAFGLNHPDDYQGGIETNVELQAAAIKDYFWSDAHWFYPVIGVGADYPINERYYLGIDIRLWYPLSTAEDWRVGIGFRFSPRKISK